MPLIVSFVQSIGFCLFLAKPFIKHSPYIHLSYIDLGEKSQMFHVLNLDHRCMTHNVFIFCICRYFVCSTGQQ